MNTHTRNPDVPEKPDGTIPAYDSETGVIQDTTSVRDLASYRRYLLLRSRLFSGKNGRRQDGGGQALEPSE